MTLAVFPSFFYTYETRLGFLSDSTDKYSNRQIFKQTKLNYETKRTQGK